MRVGNKVVAVEPITEQNFAGKKLHTHALRGDVGRVWHVDGDWITVTFERTGTTTGCDRRELELAKNQTAAA